MLDKITVMRMTASVTLALLLAGVASQSAPPQAPAAEKPATEKWPGVDPRPPNAPNQKPAVPGQTRAPERKTNVAFEVVTVAEGLTKPWGFAFLPDGRILVTEKGTNAAPAALRVVDAKGTLSPAVVGVPKVDARGQGGLLDVVLGPHFAQDQTIYWCFSDPAENGMNHTAVARGKLVDGPAPRLDDVQTIYRQSPSLSSTMHYGCRLVWSRDGTLFVTQGDRSVTPGRMQAQQMDSGIGKIVRINADGTIPKDNPFVGKEGVRPEIWSYGHRNVQAATLHPTTGELWEVEHGTRGGDEINIARKGKDYGWPTIAYGIEYQGAPITGGITQKDGMEQPIYYWDPVIAPSGMFFYTGTLFQAWRNSLFIGGLVTTNIVRLDVEGDKIVGEERLLKDLQPKPERIRDVKQGPEGAIYAITDQTPGRIVKLVPKK
jgi:glucose/arabinose dehydrogenase